jgi:hypothetical protein
MSSDQQQLSRRDWFRLRVPKQNHDSLGSDQHGGLQPLAEPPNHDGLNLAELPPVHETILAPEQVRALFSDLRHHAHDVQLMVRGNAATDSELSERLRLTCDRLLNGDISKMQVRYHWQDARWIDTLERKPDGIRIVRIRRV